MSDGTRDLLSFAIGRNVWELVTLVVLNQTPSLQKDGSFTVTRDKPTKMARVVSLTQNEINRLIAGGVTVNDGYSVSFAEEVTKVPDQVIRANGVYLKVVKFTVAENASVFICDAAPLAPNEGFEP